MVPRSPLAPPLGLSLLFLAACAGHATPRAHDSTPRALASAAAPDASATAPPLPAYREPAACAGAADANAPPSAARQVVQGQHVAMVHALAIAENGLLASASEDGSVRIWDVPRRALVRVVRSETVGEPRNVAWTAAGDRFFASGRNITTVTFDLAGRELASRDHGYDVWLRTGGSVALVKGAQDFSKDVLWIEDERGQKIELRHKGLAPNEITRSADRGTIVAPDGKNVAVWRAAPGSVVDAQLLATDGRVLSAASDPTGQRVIAAVERKSLGSDTAVELLSTKPGEGPRVLAGGSKYLQQVVATADGSRAAAVAYDGVWLYDLATGSELWSHASDSSKLGHAGDSTSGKYARGAFSPDGRYLVVAENDGSLVAFDAASGRLHGELGSLVRAPRAFAFAPGGETIVAATDDRVSVWSTKSGALTERHDAEDVAGVSVLAGGDVALVEHPQYGGCTVGSESWALERWTGTTPPARDAGVETPFVTLDQVRAQPRAKPQKQPIWPPPRGRSVNPICVPGRAEVVSMSLARAVVSVDAAGKDKAATYAVDLDRGARVPLEKYDELNAIAPSFSPDGRFVLATTGSGLGLNNALAVWDARSGRLVRRSAIALTLTGPRGSMDIQGVHRFALTADAKTIAVVYGKRVSLRDFASDKESASFDAAAAITAVTFGGGQTLYVGLEDGTLAAYDGANRRASGASPGGPVRAIAVDEKSGAVASASDDGGVRLWDRASGQLDATLVDFDDDEWLAFTPAGAYGGTEEVSDRVAWAFDDPPEVFRFEQFARTYANPALVAARLAGKPEDAPPVTRRPPRVTLAAPPEMSGARAKLRVHASSASRVDAVRVFVEGRPVAAQAVCAQEGDVDVQVPLDAGINRVTVSAFDDRGAASNPTVVDVTSAAAQRADVWVVAAGVSRYPRLPEKYQLVLANADARGVADAFAAQAGPGKTYDQAHVTTLTDEQVTVESLTRALDGLAQMRPEDVAIVVLAGHGVKPSPADDMVFLTSTAELTRASAQTDGVGWKEIGARLAAAKGRVLVLLDACHSGHVTQDVVVPNNDLASSLVKEQRAGVLVFAAAKGRQLSYEPSGSRGLSLTQDTKPLVQTGEAHGLFTGALLRALVSKETDRDGDGVIAASELVDAVSTRVARASNGLQTPWVARRELFGDFHLVQLPK